MTTEKGGYHSVLEFQRTSNGLPIERFLWLHAGCGTEMKTETINSSETDPTTGDLLPLIKTTFVCNVHNVKSASEVKILGV